MQSLERIPHTIIGAGSARELGGLLPELFEGKFSSIILVTGKSSFDRSNYGKTILSSLQGLSVPIHRVRFGSEPSPEEVDEAIGELRQLQNKGEREKGCVVAIGGGSVIDGAKALAMGMLQEKGMIHYLEGLGDCAPRGKRLPLAVLPTTSGTGSEATKNSVLTRTGAGGFKKSLRHSALIPDLVVLDPELTLELPMERIIPAGLDGVCQLLEAFVSSRAGTLTDNYAAPGLALAGEAFPGVCDSPDDVAMREKMALAAFYSGISLANAGLGFVHGAASPLGAAHPVPHGVVCGLLLHPASAATIEALGRDTNREGMGRYAQAGYLVSRKRSCLEDAKDATGNTKGMERGIALLLDTLSSWRERYPLPALSAYGFTRQELAELSPSCGFKNAPARFPLEEVRQVLFSVL